MRQSLAKDCTLISIFFDFGQFWSKILFSRFGFLLLTVPSSFAQNDFCHRRSCKKSILSRKDPNYNFEVLPLKYIYLNILSKTWKKGKKRFTVFNSQSMLEIGGLAVIDDGQTVIKEPFRGKILGLKFNGIRILDKAREAIQSSTNQNVRF